ncbi:hypothetical protein S7335_2264 [Synechococcus sp. PCC 7335]|uniref:haloacid dehalogenase-like hydrolase n=1 Tax=Synechococcus sp. (strain ATCC 29403 / PCC 7335) TaxID=91464 RepID=UPI00017EC3EC|nr:haloacid dehalogenase-like hydrolase [Synechococcus sp. PCC 7335]EDX84567.1 hypothetical protein S7335_2264 [Synechococcus sp. PCC 7335]
MRQITRVTTNRIAVVFDFDETLTPRDSFAVLLESCGLNSQEFQENRVKALVQQGWEKYLARAYSLIQESHRRDHKITQDLLAKVGQNIPLYEGTDKLFERLQQAIHRISSNIELEFYLISGGFVDISRNTAIAKDFKRMWGCELHYDETGAVDFIKKQMTHTEKTRYLYYLSKGIEDSEDSNDLIYNYSSFPQADLHIPLSQVIYVGDGASDVPCFDVMKQYGGISIGIYPEDSSAEEWEYMDSISQTQRLSNLVPAAYEEDSELVKSLYLCVECVAKQIKLSQLRVKEK